MKDALEQMLPKVSAFRAELVRTHCRSEDDLVALATLYAMEAGHIWRQLGGSKLEAVQFYAFADRAATAQ